MKNVFRDVLNNIEKNGLHEGHHLYITFKTNDNKVIIPKWLLDKFPTEMTIVIQYEYWNFKVTEENFKITLSFNDIKCDLFIPYNSVISFADPYANFGLKLNSFEKSKEKKDNKKTKVKETKRGIIVMYEPQHLKWKKSDAFTVMLIRNLLNFCDHWYDSNRYPKNKKEINKQVNEIFEEYILERDLSEKGGQSPNDLQHDKDDILFTFNKKFKLINEQPSFSFIYRLLGGLRGHEKKIKEIASFLALIDKFGIENNILNANYFYATFLKE